MNEISVKYLPARRRVTEREKSVAYLNIPNYKDRMKNSYPPRSSCHSIVITTTILIGLIIFSSSPHVFAKVAPTPPLSRAILDNDLDQVKTLVEIHHCSIDSEHPRHDSALQLAARKGHFEIAKYLIEKGADLTQGEMQGESALDIARRFNHPDIVELIEQELSKFWEYADIPMDRDSLSIVKDYVGCDVPRQKPEKPSSSFCTIQ